MTDTCTRARQWIATAKGSGYHALWARMSLVDTAHTGHPYDAGDIRTICSLLTTVPEWRGRLGEMANVSHEWAAICAAWPELSANPDAIRAMHKRKETREERMRRMLGAALGEPPLRKEKWSDVQADFARLCLSERIDTWIVGGDVGMSSKTIWMFMSGLSVDEDQISHPYDPSDLGRCLRLLELIPEWKPRIIDLGSLSPSWSALAARWHELDASMRSEVGIDWEKAKSAPVTYKLMKSILESPEPKRERHT